jgi:hypothetical protein
MNKSKLFFETPNTPSATVIHASGGTLTSYRVVDGKIYFQFSDPTFCQKIEQSFLTDQLSLNPRKLFDSQNMIRTAIRSLKEKNASA